MTANTYDRQTARFLAVVGENMPRLPGEVMQAWMEDPIRLQCFLDGLLPPHLFPTWKAITLGTGLKTSGDFRQALSKGFQITSGAEEILNNPAFIVSPEEIDVELVVLTTAELVAKRKGGGTTSEVFSGAMRLKLQECPPEVGPQLRLQYKDQMRGKWLVIGMKSIEDSRGHPRVFEVCRFADSLRLSSLHSAPDLFWQGSVLWVFSRPCK